MGNTPQTQYREFKRETRNRSCKKSEAPDFSEAFLRPPAEFGDFDIGSATATAVNLSI
jgi:hypothetical protein